MSRNDFCSNYLAHSFLAHHGILGQKWGIRRFQNPDGTLTSEGRARYGREAVLGNVGRAVFNGLIGQRVGTELNRGYRKDKKEIKGLYKEKKNELKSKMTDENKKETKEQLKSLKSDYKKTLREANTTAANVLYDWQSPKANEKIQSMGSGEAIIKSLLLGDSGARVYEYAKGRDRGTGEAVVEALLTRASQYYTGVPAIADYVIGKSRANKAGGYKEQDKAAKAKAKEEKAVIKEAGKKAAAEVAKTQKRPLTSRDMINNAVERGLAENRARKEAESKKSSGGLSDKTIKSRVEYAKKTGKYDMEFLERVDRYVDEENHSQANMLKGYEEYLREHGDEFYKKK